MAWPVNNATTSWIPDTNATDDPGSVGAVNLANTIQTYCIVFIGLFLNILAAVAWSKPGCSRRHRTCATITRATLVWVDLLSITGYIIRGGLTPVLKQFNYDLYCDIFGFTNITFSLTSGFIAGVMSVDRFGALTSPFTYRARFTPRRITVVILLLVIFSTIVGSLPFVGIGSYHTVDYFHGKTVCKLAWYPDEPPLFVLHFAVYQVVGWCLLLVVVMCNVGVIRTLLSMKKHVASAGTQPSNMDTKQEVRFVRTMMLITLFFALCWVPWMITTILIKVGSETTLQGDLLATRLLLANSAFDPLIFMVTSEALCSRVRKWTTRLLRRLFRVTRTDSVLQLNSAAAKENTDATTCPTTGFGKFQVTTTSSLSSLNQTIGPVITVTEAPSSTGDLPSCDGSPTGGSAVMRQEFGASTESLVPWP
ncbi:prostacyclin receptor-like [Patiria miniata]|uniref:G-protein coupled receptors family 1 profile domain-containing protein n=1 Tax=Patiria miniata TaxID=46514 RepID=A0A914A7S5_PATMI|nr:prostacyclin receptor-like [Patiria miniata]XP_038059845.1 prostacyclin receptor-like [Patiria miniata]